MTYFVQRLGDNDFWCEQDDGTPFPASFLNRPSAELVCGFLNRMDAQAVTACLEPIKVKLSPGRVNAGAKKPMDTIKLDGYAVQKPDKQLAITTNEPEPAPKPVVKATL